MMFILDLLKRLLMFRFSCTTFGHRYRPVRVVRTLSIQKSHLPSNFAVLFQCTKCHEIKLEGVYLTAESAQDILQAAKSFYAKWDSTEYEL